jgi:phytoene desaturase (3,4-didehydrolycopene-forming)
LGSLAYSNGVLIYCWAIDRKVDGLLHHNVFVSDNRREAWNPARNADELQQFPNFYVHVPSRTDATAAPDGCESVMVLLPVANLQLTKKEKYPDLVRQGKECILKSLEASGVRLDQHIVAEKIVTPDELGAKYGLKYGAAFGLSHGLDQLSLFRPGNKEDVCSGLYFTGASTRPGNGVPLCFISAKLTAERILKDTSCLT